MWPSFSDGKPDDGPIEWDRLYREMAGEPYFMSGDMVSDLTLWQLRALRCKESDLPGPQQVDSLKQAEAIRKRHDEWKRSIVDGMVE